MQAAGSRWTASRERAATFQPAVNEPLNKGLVPRNRGIKLSPELMNGSFSLPSSTRYAPLSSRYADIARRHVTKTPYQ